MENNQLWWLAPAPLSHLSLSLILSPSLKTLFHFLTLPSSLLSPLSSLLSPLSSLLSPRCLELVCSISAPLSSFLPSLHLFCLSHPLFISALLLQLEQSILPVHTQRDLSLFTTRHHWHNLLTATLNYFCMRSAFRSLLACQAASSQRRGG